MKRPIAMMALAACAPISTQTRNSETLLSSERVRDKAGEPSIVGAVQLASDALVVEARVEHRCRETLIERTRTTRHVTRNADKLFLGLEIGLGVVFGAGGGGLIWDSAAEQRRFFTDAEPDLERTVGIATAAVGGFLLLASMIDGVRARDRVQELGEASRRRPAGTVAQACGEKPGAGLTIAATNARGEAVLGSTDRSGALSIPLLSFPGALVDGANPPAEARIVARTEDGSVDLGVVNLSSTRHAHATRARSEAESANVPERWDDLATRFPEEHGVESRRRAREMRLAAARASLAAGDLVAARATLGVLELRDRDDAEVVAFASELTAREATHEREELWRKAAELTAALGAPGSSAAVDQFDAAAEAITTAEARGADVRAGELRAALDAARTQRLAAALGAVKQARQDLVAARAAMAVAETLAPGDAKVVKAKRELDVREAAQLARQARTRAAAKDWGEAATLYARAAQLNPRDRTLARERDRMQKKSDAQAAAAAKVPPVAVATPATTTTTRAPATTVPATAATASTAPPPTTPSPTVPTTTASTTTSATTPTTPETTASPATSSAPTAPATTATSSSPTTPATEGAPAPVPAVSVPRATSIEAPSVTVPDPVRARASARFMVAPRVGRAPIDWAFLPRGCSGQFAGAELRVTCSDAHVHLVRTEAAVDATCEADSCDRCAQLQTSIMGRAKLDKTAARCEEAVP